MQKLGFVIAAGMLALALPGLSRAEPFGSGAVKHAVEASSPVQPAACREQRQGWHGSGWYPCKGEPANACEKCRWRWGYKYCWKIC